jgi:hypothetical protein
MGKDIRAAAFVRTPIALLRKKLDDPAALPRLMPIRTDSASARYDPDRPMSHSQREFWNGPPERLPDAFRMTKQKRNTTEA